MSCDAGCVSEVDDEELYELQVLEALSGARPPSSSGGSHHHLCSPPPPEPCSCSELCRNHNPSLASMVVQAGRAYMLSWDVVRLIDEVRDMTDDLGFGRMPCRPFDCHAPELKHPTPCHPNHLRKCRNVLLSEEAERLAVQADKLRTEAEKLRPLVDFLKRRVRPVALHKACQTRQRDDTEEYLQAMSKTHQPVFYRAERRYREPVEGDPSVLKVSNDSPALATLKGKHRDDFVSTLARNTVAFLNSQQGGKIVFGVFRGRACGFVMRRSDEIELRKLVDDVMTHVIVPPVPANLYSLVVETLIQVPDRKRAPPGAELKLLTLEVMSSEGLPCLYMYENHAYMRDCHETYAMTPQARITWHQLQDAKPCTEHLVTEAKTLMREITELLRKAGMDEQTEIKLV